MRLLIPALLLSCLLGCQSPAETTFYVEGACEACQPLIEQAVQAVPGVEEAQWDYETSLLTVTYQPGEEGEEPLQQAIAQAGFETQFYPADGPARAQLPACCQQPIERRLKQNDPHLPAGH
jgi:periplasmic mercuric ion binding protein